MDFKYLKRDKNGKVYEKI
ncbi:hypothetical protein [Streptobacillus moniliformis]